MSIDKLNEKYNINIDFLEYYDMVYTLPKYWKERYQRCRQKSLRIIYQGYQLLKMICLQ